MLHVAEAANVRKRNVDGFYDSAGGKMPANFKDLIVWQKSIDFADEVYDTTEHFPKSEVFGLANQMRRAAVSVASNIAEGSARHSRRDFVRFLRQSRGSLAELETQITISVRRKYITREQGKKLFAVTIEIERMLSGVVASLKAKKEQQVIAQ
jgi:four helix bundle protein